jgi:tryptophan synthase beta subunit
MAETGRGGTGTAVFPAFLQDPSVQLIGAQPTGRGLNTDKAAAAILKGEEAVLHGMRTLVIKTSGEPVSHSIAPAMDYPAADPVYVYWQERKKVKFVAVNDFEAMEAAYELMNLEGITPSLETAHALALLKKIPLSSNDKILICIGSDGEKDREKYKAYAEVMG